jgi:acetylserotonin N-methyltransferase
MTTSAAVVLDLIEAFRRSKTMFAAVSLGVFDRLEEAPATAACLGGNERGMADLLDACVGLGLLEKDGVHYRNTAAASAYLVRKSPDTLTGYILYSNDVLYKLWGNLESAVQEGTHRWNQTFGFDGPLFSHFFRTDDAMRTFLMGMHGFGMLSSPGLVRAFDLGSFRRMVDLGGATGHLCIAACEAYPDLRGIVFDLPRVTELAREHIARSKAAGRIEVTGGDFFEDPLPEADLFALGRILHDWTEEKILTLLRKIHAALPAGGAVLVCEKLLDEDRRGPISGQMQSLNMLVCTEGRERTLSEYSALLVQAGFGDVEGVRMSAPLDAVLARKPR